MENDKKTLKKMEKFRLVFHGTALFHHCIAGAYSKFPVQDYSNVTDQRVLDVKDFELKFFTTWNMVFQTLYFALAFSFDLSRYVPILKPHKKLLDFNGYIFTAVVFPCSCYVSLLFWTIYYINREYVLPEVVDEFVPTWLNHMVHTNIVPFVMVEIFMTNLNKPSLKSAILGLTGLTIIYKIIFFHTYFQTGRWIYALFSVLTWNERVAISLFNYMMTVCFLKLGSSIQKYKHKIIENKYVTKYEKFKKDLLLNNPIY